ncbi:MAG: hypothetical protein Q8O29_17730 [Polaromonas sp.]|uniref:hypothetical protein n=1 Tax=Polaromonas sp. TaxID=1869339 RepID=UPI0027326DB7|nr:hypothetical protein [Polaromonas sp.]MDP2820075.1 hypothetical protein [Polaromonas sp.]
MSTRFSRILQLTPCLFVAGFYAAAHAAPSGETWADGETGGPPASRYGRGYEARQGLDLGDRPGRIERPEHIQRIERVERIERLGRIERIERPGRGR